MAPSIQDTPTWDCADLPLVSLEYPPSKKEGAGEEDVVHLSPAGDGCATSSEEDDFYQSLERSIASTTALDLDATIVESTKVEGILRRSKYINGDDDDPRGPSPAIAPRSVHFPASLVTSVRTRPRVHAIDVPALFYSPQDVRRFKREYRRLLRSQRMAREQMERNSSAGNSFWRSKLGRYGTAPTASTRPLSESRVLEAVDSWDPLKDGGGVASSPTHLDGAGADSEGECAQQMAESTSSYSGIFSSVVDVARDAVSILSGPSSTHYGHRPTASSSSKRAPRKKPCNTSLHLVDTLYLF